MAKSKKRPIPASTSTPRFSVNINNGGTEVTIFRESVREYVSKVDIVAEVVTITFGKPGVDKPKVNVNVDVCEPPTT